MGNKSLFEDTFEKMAEMGKSTVKSATQSVTGSAKPTQKSTADLSGNFTAELLGINTNPELKAAMEAGGHTPLDIANLQQGYKNQDQNDMNAVREKLIFFRDFKDREKKAIDERKRDEKQRLQKIQVEEEEKKKQQDAKNLQPMEAPKGKERRSILSRKKVVKRNQMETRADSGKQ